MGRDEVNFTESIARLKEMADAVGGAKLILDDVVGDLREVPATEGLRAKIVAVSMTLSMVAGGLEATEEKGRLGSLKPKASDRLKTSEHNFPRSSCFWIRGGIAGERALTPSPARLARYPASASGRFRASTLMRTPQTKKCAPSRERMLTSSITMCAMCANNHQSFERSRQGGTTMDENKIRELKEAEDMAYFRADLCLYSPDSYTLDEKVEICNEMASTSRAIVDAMREDFSRMPPELQERMPEELCRSGVEPPEWWREALTGEKAQ